MTVPRGWFVTGTDTGVGKTGVALGLMYKLQAQGCTVAGMKPVASGCVATADGLRNNDARRLQQQSSLQLDYSQVNPYAFEPPIAPHLAAAQAGVRIETSSIIDACMHIATQVDYVIVEGIGGWLVPLNEQQTLADLARGLQLPVILVVGIRIGCLNHAQLTVESVVHHGVHLAGWVANCLLPVDITTEANIAALETRIQAPLLGILPWVVMPDASTFASHLRLPEPCDT
jgi:dethiobiotin synthetase